MQFGNLTAGAWPFFSIRYHSQTWTKGVKKLNSFVVTSMTITVRIFVTLILVINASMPDDIRSLAELTLISDYWF